MGKIIVKTGLNHLLKILIDKLLEWIKDRIDELIEMLLSQFDELFEEIGEKIIIIQETVGNILDKIIEKVNSVINLIKDIEKIITNILDIIQSKGDITVVITNLINISDFMLENGIKNLTQPITDIINTIKTGIKNTVNNEYNKIKNEGIKYYETQKSKINKEYTKVKNKVVNLPDNLTKKLNEKKKEFEEEYKKKKKQIIKNTDIKLKKVIDTKKIEKTFYDIINKVKSNIDIETNIIKEEIKNNINDSNKFIMNLYDDIINFINECVKFDIDKYVDNKLNALEETVIFILDIVSEKYEIEKLNENALRGLLISHFKEKIILCEFLIGNKLLQIIIKIKEYTKGKLYTINTFYDLILNKTKQYLNLLLQDAKGYLSKSFKYLDAFDFFIQYIEKIYKNCCIYELYFIDKLKSINSFITENAEKINEIKNKKINNLTNILEQKIEKEYNKLVHMKDNVKYTINNTFNTFENKVVKPIDDQICGSASDIENKLINMAQHLDGKAEKYLQMIYPNDFDSKSFNFLKKKKDNLLNKLGNEELNAGINRFCNSNLIDKSRNIIDKIDLNLNKVTSITNDISRISNSLKIANKDEFRNNIKSKIKNKILQLYRTQIEKELREFIIKACRKLNNKI